jgi:hypothetical protein
MLPAMSAPTPIALFLFTFIGVRLPDVQIGGVSDRTGAGRREGRLSARETASAYICTTNSEMRNLFGGGSIPVRDEKRRETGNIAG